MAREKTDLTDALMAFGGGFGKASGPSIPPKAVPQFGNSPQFPSPPSSSSPPIFPITTAPQQRSPRLDTTANLLPSNGFAGAPQKVWSPPLALGSNSPSKGVPNSIPGAQRPKASPSSWGNHPKSPIDSSFQYHQTEFPVESYATPPNDLTGVATRSVKSQGPKRTRSPSFTNDASLEDSAETFAGRLGSQPGFVLEHGRTRAPQRTGPPSSAFQSSHTYEDLDNPVEDVQRSSTNIANFQASRSSRSPPFPSANKAFLGDSKPLQIDNERSSTNISTFQASRSSRSPPFPSTDKVLTRDSQPLQNESGRRVSPPKFGDRANMLDYTSDSHMKQKSSNFAPNIAERNGTRPVNTQVSKRTRSPSHYADEFLQGNSHDSQDNTEREMQAKARRLARFKVELSEPAEDSQNILKQKVSGNRHGQAPVEKIKFAAGQSGEAVGDFMLDSEGPEPPSVIIGVCPDMCPESERKERERKGDLDKYERLDGDRNQTTESIAVKKYNRTAEREVDLIRPMPVLQKTAAYLLDLLDQPYSDSFLGLYNFLWDRMRAIRMDLRMQHIFNRDAISMLEQMIRLHIIAMHELCEYTKGEGFSEGFDAHLNIEQMNKTSVELFQMYDDHRKRGIDIPSEKEFRGYYALLKLDKHPGYKVEPAELSLDLAKMTPEIRQTPEILFARAVARACRTGNFIAFFRLARQATYLQACLMHAHFAKLRTQALASLHSGLQNNQGIPIAHVTKWLGMEGEDIESLLEYHGFTVKEFEESYMVKEGPFLSNNEDYATKCSQLVLLKKSRTVLEDVSSKSSDHIECSPKEVKHIISEKVPKTVPVLKRKSSLDAEMLDFKDNSASIPKFQPVVGMPLAINQQNVPVAATQQKMTVAATQQKMAVATTQQKISAATNQGLSDRRVSEVSSVPWVVPSSLFTQSPPVTVRSVTGQVTLPNKSLDVNHNPFLEAKPLQPVVETLPIDMSGSTDSLMKNLTPQAVLINPQENVDTIVPQEVEEESTIDEDLEDEEAKMIEQEMEAAKAKLKLILRMWKKRSSKQKKMRDQRQLVANAALNSLSLGPPIRQNKTQLNHVGELNIDRVLRERGERHGKSWSKLNVSEVVTSTLSERNPDAKCLCWKLLLCPQMKNKTHNLVGSWLRSKLMGNGKENDDELAVSAPGLSVWKWFINGSSNSRLCCLSVVRDVERDKSGDAVRSASGVLFQVSDGIPWKLQKTALNDLLMSLPSGQSLPLLILTDMHDEQVQSSSSTIVNELGLRYIDKARISSFSIVHLLGNQQSENLDGFFSKDRLMEGLRWVANQAPLQPFLHCVKTHELVMGYLNYSLELLQRRGELLGPNDCIGAFNAAVDRATEEVASASDMNLGSWPCTEIDLLEEFSDERRATESFLPSACWSESSSIKPILSTIQSCKLPFFADDLSWLSHGSDMGKDIQNKKSELEKCLITYLVNLSKMMEWELATKEASVMLQNGAELELHGRAFRIIPRWVVILRRVFNWRLLNLRSGISSVAYVFDKQRDSWLEPYQVVSPLKSRDGEVNMGFNSSTSEGVSKLRLDEDRSPPYALTRLTLDEMIEVGCSPLPFGRNKSEIKTIEPLQLAFNEDDDITEAHTESDNQWHGEIAERDGRTDNHLSTTTTTTTTTSSIVVEKDKTEADRLSKLLEQCNMLQDRIDEQLFIYF